MAISTYGVYLMKKGTSGSTYDKLVDIKSYPNLGGKPEALETTSLSDGMRTYIPGIQDTEDLEFTANYDKTAFNTLKALADTETDFAVWFGHDSTKKADGHDGKFSFKGKLSVFATGGSVNEVAEMTITITPSTEITFAST